MSIEAVKRSAGPAVMGKKRACNTVEENQIRRMAAEEMDLQTISDALIIHEECVRSVMDDFFERREHYERLWYGEGAALTSQMTSHNEPGGKGMKRRMTKKAEENKENLLE